MEADKELVASGEDWTGGDVVFRSAMTLWREDKASLDSVVAAGAGEPDLSLGVVAP